MTLYLKRWTPDSHSLNHYLSIHVIKLLFFLSLKCLIPTYSCLLPKQKCSSHFYRDATIENKKFARKKWLIYLAYLINKVFKGTDVYRTRNFIIYNLRLRSLSAFPRISFQNVCFKIKSSISTPVCQVH